jgi:outer membrane protein assembly factor BamB
MNASSVHLRYVLSVLFLAISVGQGSSAAAQEAGLKAFPRLSAEGDWPWWRGPSRDGRAPTANPPFNFGEKVNVRWKTPVPGRGHSSPIVVGERVFLTTAEESHQRQKVMAFDRQTGAMLWETVVNEGGFPANNHPKNTEASPTLASDGEKLFATFFHHQRIQLTFLGLDGERLRQKDLMPFHPQKYEYGYAPSPIVYGPSVIVSGEYDGESFLLAVDRQSGEVLWKTPRPVNVSFSSPVVARLAGKDQLLISGANRVSAYDPATGKMLWEVPGTTNATCGTLVWDEDLVFASGGFPKAETLAVKADGTGQVLWRNHQKCYEQSMVTHRGYLYALTDKGILFCWRGVDGQEMWQERLRGPVSASPVLVGDRIYWANELGTFYVFRATPERFELVAENQLGDEAFASPAVAGQQLFLRVAVNRDERRQEYLYCIAGSTP